MLEKQDRYSKLRPPDPTPDDELCHCPDAPPIKLMVALGYNPLHCMNCNLEVPPETLDLDADLVQALAYWRWVYDALYRLWLASGQYEAWAVAQLTDLGGEVNTEGRALQQTLDKIRRCYYLYFQDESAEDYAPLRHCPACGQPLTTYTASKIPERVCESCGIVVFGA
jgi:predicted  nucleic acid-binding Zn ribbon protein